MPIERRCTSILGRWRGGEGVLRPGDPKHEDDVRRAIEASDMNPITRRRFLQVAGLVAASFAAGAGLSGCESAAAMLSGERTVVDDVGRTVVIPSVDQLKRVYFTSGLAEIFVFTVAPDLRGGTCSQYDARQLKYLPEGTDQLIQMGSLSSGGTIDREALIYNDIQVVFSISGTDLTDVNVSDAEKLQEQTGIPVVLIDGSFNIIADTYRFLGECLGREERAEELATYMEDIYNRVSSAVAGVSEADRVRFYYAEGPQGLQTEPNASQHSLAFQVAGGNNVVEGVGVTAGGGMSNVSLESVIKWDPDAIVAWSADLRGGADLIIRSSSDWESISAVRQGRVYTMPNLPFAWCDRPPGVNRFIGIQWLANLFYPDAYPVDMVAVTREFYKKCYWCDLTDEESKQIIAGTL